MNDVALSIPKTIWMLWSDGFDQAPPVVQACVRSWRLYHPAWSFQLLDYAGLRDFVDLESLTGKPIHRLDPVVVSDLVRSHVLAQYGGVWVDATCYCNRPLESWLIPCLNSGFFAFSNPGPDRLLSTWFLAARPGNVLVATHAREAVRYWRNHWFFRRDQAHRFQLWLEEFLRSDPRWTRRSLSWPVTRVLHRYPYFWSHYLYARIIERDAACRAVWKATPFRDAIELHRLQHGAGLEKPMDRETRALVYSGTLPLYKLSWKFKGYEPGSPLAALLDEDRSGLAPSPPDG